MRRSQLFLPTSKQPVTGKDTGSIQLVERAGLIHSYGSGIYGYTPVGYRVLANIEAVIRRVMNQAGGQEVVLPLLQNADIWEESGRWKNFEAEEKFTLENREDREMCLAPTHEEAVVAMIRGKIRSYNDLPLTVYQLGRKFRDDHARHGLLRTKEFSMKDAYSFHTDQSSLDKTYEEMRSAYKTIFNQLGVNYFIVAADTGPMGGTGSEEFLAPAQIGSDTFKQCTGQDCNAGTKQLEDDTCPRCGAPLSDAVNGIELGHIFKLGTRYSKSMNLIFDTETGEKQPVVMGCYGIGTSRIIPALIEQHHDEEGITWSTAVAPFTHAVIPARHEQKAVEKAEELYNQLNNALLYDGEQSVGEAFAEADLLGIPYKVIVGTTFLNENRIEVEERTGDTHMVDADPAQIAAAIRSQEEL